MSDISMLLGPQEFFERFQGRYYGKYRALVKDTADPEKLGRVRVLCETIYGPDFSPWAMPCFPMGSGIDSGFFSVPPVDSMVWIEFEEGMTTQPIYVGGFYAKIARGRYQDRSPIESSRDHQRNNNPIPLHAQGLPDGSDFDGSSKGAAGSPASSFAGEYPNVHIMRTRAGHMLEFDDTPGAERVQLVHKTGANLEILPDGSVVQLCEGSHTLKARAQTVRIDGESREKILGSKTLEISGDYVLNVGGSYRVSYGAGVNVTIPREDTTVTGDDIRRVQGSWKRTVLNNFSLQSGGDGSIGTFGNLNIQVGGFGSMIFSNAQGVPNPIAETLNIIAQNGKLTLKATDITGALASLGVEIQPQGTQPLLTPVPVPASIGPHIFIGNLLLPPTRSPVAIPQVQENAVLGVSLVQYLTSLHGFLQSWLSDYLAHAHPWYSPSYTSVAQAAILPAQLTALQAAFLTPAGLKLNPILLSDTVYMGK